MAQHSCVGHEISLPSWDSNPNPQRKEYVLTTTNTLNVVILTDLWLYTKELYSTGFLAEFNDKIQLLKVIIQRCKMLFTRSYF